jgi:hypothetical protein
MTASLSAPYALVGEKTPSQPAHQKSLPPGPPHASIQVPVAIETKPVTKASVSVVKAKPLASAPLVVTNVPALPAEPVVIKSNLPDVPTAGN